MTQGVVLLYDAGLLSANFFRLRVSVDLATAEAAHDKGCPHCGGRLDWAPYERRPHGPEDIRRNPLLGMRLSLCCSREGCRRRLTPFSLVFMRMWYVGAVVLLVGALRHGPARVGLEKLRAVFGPAAATIRLWRAWWLTMLRSRFWRSVRGMLAGIREDLVPWSLLEAFRDPDPSGRLAAALRLLAPTTSRSAPGSLAF
jgi:hypothetical protein